MATELLGPEALSRGPDGVEFTLTIPNPSITTYPVTLNIRKAWTLTGITFIQQGSSTPTATFDVFNDGTGVVGLTAVAGTSTKQSATPTAPEAMVAGNTMEIDVTAVGGTREFFVVTFHGEWT